MATPQQDVAMQVGFNQQQRQLLEQLRLEGTFGESEAEVVGAVFLEWLKEEGLI